MAQHSKPGASGTSRRGFASMDPALQREIASKGGRSVPPEERSFSKDRALAAQAGRKGGEASHGTRRPVSVATDAPGAASTATGSAEAGPGTGTGTGGLQPGMGRSGSEPGAPKSS